MPAPNPRPKSFPASAKYRFTHDSRFPFPPPRCSQAHSKRATFGRLAPPHLLDDFRCGLDADEIGNLLRVFQRVSEHVLVAEKHDVLRVGLGSLVPLQYVVEPGAVLTPGQSGMFLSSCCRMNSSPTSPWPPNKNEILSEDPRSER